MNIGIDKISFYVPNQYINMRELAKWRNVDPDKFTIGIGQDEMSVPFPSQDPVTLAANAALKILTEDDKKDIDMVLLATESGIDYSKAMALTVRKLLGINPRVRCLDLKEACYSGTGAIQLAKAHIAINPDKKVLILTTDISRYGLFSAGEPTQGAGGVAMIMSKNPRILEMDNIATYYTDDVMDFWRPEYSEVAIVDGKYSNEQYQRFFDVTLNDYLELTNSTIKDIDAICLHIPYTKIGVKALQSVITSKEHPRLYENYFASTTYNRRVGNVYTGSLFVSFVSLLDAKTLKANDQVGFYSYGSGSIGEFFVGRIVEGYEEVLYKGHEDMLNNRIKISQESYETQYEYKLPTDGSLMKLDFPQDQGPFVLDRVENHIRYYKKI